MGKDRGGDGAPKSRRRPDRDRQRASSRGRGRGDRRAALSNVGGEVELRGDPAFGAPLRRVLESVDAGVPSLGIHAFHSYPARMHPAIAREVMAAFGRGARGTLLDPFCGGGTTIVEAMRVGWRTLGTDLNPLALDLTRVKGARMKAPRRAALLETVGRVAAESEARVRGRVDVRAQLDAAQRAWYEVHVLKELAGLLEEIAAVEAGDERRALRMVFSAIAVKFSKQRADTAREPVVKRIRKGLVTEFFVRKAHELVEAWAELDEACVEKTLRPKVVQADVRRLGQTLSGDFRADLIVSSPPYGGTYDYAEHHALRLAWLGYKVQPFRAREIGSRRELSASSGARNLWDRQVGEMLASMGARLREDGLALLLVGDGQIGGERIDAADQLVRLAPGADLRVVASAAQRRRDYAGGAARREHLVVLERV